MKNITVIEMRSLVFKTLAFEILATAKWWSSPTCTNFRC